MSNHGWLFLYPNTERRGKEEVYQNGRRIKEPNEPMFTLTVTDKQGIVHKAENGELEFDVYQGLIRK